MKKLMLVSAFNPVSRLLPRVEPELKAKTVAFIPTASKGSLYSPTWVLPNMPYGVWM